MLKEVVVDVDEEVAGIVIETIVETAVDTIRMHRKPATSVERRGTLLKIVRRQIIKLPFQVLKKKTWNKKSVSWSRAKP